VVALLLSIGAAIAFNTSYRYIDIHSLSLLPITVMNSFIVNGHYLIRGASQPFSLQSGGYDHVVDSSSFIPDEPYDTHHHNSSSSHSSHGGLPSGLPPLSPQPTGRHIVKGERSRGVAVNLTQSPPFAGHYGYASPSVSPGTALRRGAAHYDDNDHDDNKDDNNGTIDEKDEDDDNDDDNSNGGKNSNRSTSLVPSSSRGSKTISSGSASSVASVTGRVRSGSGSGSGHIGSHGHSSRTTSSHSSHHHANININ
jgi:hypothetical protein